MDLIGTITTTVTFTRKNIITSMLAENYIENTLSWLNMGKGQSHQYK